MIIGPGVARQWKMDEKFDHFAENFLKDFKKNYVNVVNPWRVYDTMDYRDTIHFSHTDNNIMKLTGLTMNAVTVTHAISHIRGRIRDLLIHDWYLKHPQAIEMVRGETSARERIAHFEAVAAEHRAEQQVRQRNCTREPRLSRGSSGTGAPECRE